MESSIVWQGASLAVALLALILSSVLLWRQSRQMEHERNAVAMLTAIERLTDPLVIDAFSRLDGISARYPTDGDIRTRFPGSADERDLSIVSAYIGTVSTLARRGVLDPSLLADAVGVMIRRRWSVVRDFTLRRRALDGNPYLSENFEWLAMYCAWWKDVPRPARDANYDPAQFAGVAFTV